MSRSNPYAPRGMVHLLCRRRVPRPPVFPPCFLQPSGCSRFFHKEWGGGYGVQKEERGPLPFRKLFPSTGTDAFSHRSRPTEIYVLITGSNEQFSAPRVFLLSSSHAGSLVVHPSGSCRISHCLGRTSQDSQENKETIPIRFLIFTHFLKNRFFFFLFGLGPQVWIYIACCHGSNFYPYR